MSSNTYNLNDAIENWHGVVEILTKELIFKDIINIFNDAHDDRDLNDDLNNIDTNKEVLQELMKVHVFFPDSKGTGDEQFYVFKDAGAIETAAKLHGGFYAENSSDFKKAIKKLDNRQILNLKYAIASEGIESLTKLQYVKDIQLLAIAYRNSLAGSSGQLRPVDLQRVLGDDESNPVVLRLVSETKEVLIATGPLNAPRFEDVVGVDYSKVLIRTSATSQPIQNDVYKALSDMHVATFKNHPRYKELYQEVLNTLAKNLKGVQVESEVLDAVSPSSVGYGTIDKAAEISELKKIKIKPFDYQCFLMENIDTLSAYQERNADYQHIVPLSGDPGTTISKIQHGAKTSAVRQLLNLSPHVQALLVPHIKIYRVDYDKTNPTRIIRQQELEIPNFIDPEEISGMLRSGGGRFSGYGLKSFTWSLDGMQPETVENNISANLTFYFQSVQDLFQGSMAAGRSKPSPLDLLISPPSFKKIRDEAGCDPRDANANSATNVDDIKSQFSQGAHAGETYRIKVVAGWSTPPNLEDLLAPDSGIELKDIQKLRRALRSTRISLFLQQTRHNLQFKQDGSIELSIEYKAALTGILVSPQADILGGHGARLKRWNKNWECMKPKEKKELLAEKKKIENEDRLKKYKRFLNPLYGRNDHGQPIPGFIKMQTLEVNPAELMLERLGEIDDEKRRAAEARRKMSASTAERGYRLLDPKETLTPNQSKPGAQGKDMLQFVNESINTGEPIDTEAMDSSFDSSWMQHGEGALGHENIYIPFFYLGDLIDSILGRNQSIFDPDGDGVLDYMTFFGEIDIINPLLLFQASNPRQLAAADNINEAALIQDLSDAGYDFTWDGNGAIKRRINIGSIPISLDVFNVWFKDNVVKPGKDTYFLIRFLKDMCGMISEALGKTCFGNRAYNKTRFDTSIVSFSNTARTLKPGETAAVIDLARAKGNLDDTGDIAPTDSADKNKYSILQGLVLYSTDAKPKSRSGDFGQDIRDGIYHNYLGSSTGLVKSINFSRIDQQYLREAKIQKEGNLGAAQLRELYSANLELVGNTLFKNGQYIYIWPTAINTDERVATLLGLGGYFMIKSVKHTISPSGYTVSVSALQEGLRKMGGRTADVVPIRGVTRLDAPHVNPMLLSMLYANERADDTTTGAVNIHSSQEEINQSLGEAKTEELLAEGEDLATATEEGNRYSDKLRADEAAAAAGRFL